MKLSNKILIGFFAFIFLYMTAVFAEIRLKGTPNILNDTNSIVEDVKLPGDISYVIIDNMKRRIHVTSAEIPRLEVRSAKGNLLSTIRYDVSGDTVKLSENRESIDEVPYKITLFIPNRLRGISVHGCQAILDGVHQQHLTISQKGSTIWMHGSQIGRMVLHAAAQSRTEVNSTTVDSLAANIQSSMVNVYTSLNVLEGSMEDKSSLHVNGVNTIQFQKDESSRIGLYP